jgi:hypothetical protein
VSFLAPHAWSQANIQSSPPESADDIWRTLNEITRLRGTRPSRADIEQLFGARLEEQHPQPAFDGRGFATRERQYDLQLEEMRDGERHFMFFWAGTTATNPLAFPPPPGGTCIARQVVMRSLARQGWVVVAQSNALQEAQQGMSGAVLQSDRDLLTLHFTVESKCLEALSMQTGLGAGQPPPLAPQPPPSTR